MFWSRNYKIGKCQRLEVDMQNMMNVLKFSGFSTGNGDIEWTSAAVNFASEWERLSERLNPFFTVFSSVTWQHFAELNTVNAGIWLRKLKRFFQDLSDLLRLFDDITAQKINEGCNTCVLKVCKDTMLSLISRLKIMMHQFQFVRYLSSL